MACTLSIQDYLRYFLLNVETAEVANEEKSHPTSLLVATVYKYEKGGIENIFYTKRSLGGKNSEPLSLFVQDMIGNTEHHTSNGSLIRSSSFMDLSDESDTQLPRHCSVSIDLLCSRSPSKVAAEEILKLVNHCKRNSIKATIQLAFGHPFSWDNKYNKQGIQRLHERGVKLKPLNFQQVLNMMLNDLQDNLEALDELQTCRGTICIDYYMLKRAVGKFRNAILLDCDDYYQENEKNLKEMIGNQQGPSINRSKNCKLTSFSLDTYRDYFFLQNTEEIWAKLRVSLSKVKQGITEETLLFDELHNSDEAALEKKLRSGKEKTINTLLEKTWNRVSSNITVHELASSDYIVVNLTVVISEYPDRMEWHSNLQTLHRCVSERLFRAGLKKIQVESVIRYAMCLTLPTDVTSGHSTSSMQSLQSSKAEADRDHAGVVQECIHIQDMLFDMLEDLEDNLMRLGRVELGRRVNINVERQILSQGMSLLNKAISIRTEDGVYSMNSDFIDVYAESNSHT